MTIWLPFWRRTRIPARFKAETTGLVMGDGGNWIDPLSARERLHDRRIVDYYHAAEHRYEAARAAPGKDTTETPALVRQPQEALRDGQLDPVIATSKIHAQRPGPPQESDGPDPACRVLANNVTLPGPTASHGLPDVAA
jgi:hypothetical protein